MSWRSPSASSPAQPVTTTADNPHFPASRSTRPPRSGLSHHQSSLSHASLGSAIVHLARAKAEMDDDAASIRSSKSTKTVGGHGRARSFWGFTAPSVTGQGGVPRAESTRSRASSSRRTLQGGRRSGKSGYSSDECESMEMSGGGPGDEDEQEILRDPLPTERPQPGPSRVTPASALAAASTRRVRKTSTHSNKSVRSTRPPSTRPPLWAGRGSPASLGSTSARGAMEEPTPLSLDSPASPNQPTSTSRQHLAPPGLKPSRLAAPTVSTSLSAKLSTPSTTASPSSSFPASSAAFPAEKGPTFASNARAPSASASARDLLQPPSPSVSPLLEPVGANSRQRKKSQMTPSKTSWFGGLAAVANGEVPAEEDEARDKPRSRTNSVRARSPRLRPADNGKSSSKPGSITASKTAPAGLNELADGRTPRKSGQSKGKEKAPDGEPRSKVVATQTAPAAPAMNATPSRGWLSMVSRSRAPSGGDQPPLAESVRKAGEEGRAALAQSALAEDDGEITPRIEATEGGDIINPNKATQPLRPPDDDVTPSASIPASTSSWWGWGGTAPPPGPKAEPEPEHPPPRTDEPMEIDEPADSLPEVNIPDEPEDPGKGSWLRSLWGEYPEETAARKRREAVEALRAKHASTTSTGTARGNAAVDVPPSPSLSATSTASTDTSGKNASAISTAAPLPQQVQALKHKSSWSFFRSSGASKEPAASESLAAPAIIPGSSASSAKGSTKVSHAALSRSPAAAGGSGSLAPSAASIRSYTSTGSRGSASDAPSSPNFGPVPDGPPRPLTGSAKPSTTSLRALNDDHDPPIENLVLPTFEDSFMRVPRSFPPKKTALTKAVSVVSAYWFGQPPSPKIEKRTKDGALVTADPAERLPKALEVMEEPSRVGEVKRVVTIGVHGWFPNPRLKSVLGEPTGTSVKFATMMHDSVQAYLEAHHEAGSFNIQAIALEGEGQVDDRVNKLYDQLIGRDEWVQAIRKADIVFLATHSQGSVVSTQLLARLLEQGMVHGQRTHMLAMCAIAQGPFVYLSQSYALSPYFQYIESPAARELFEFQDPDSAVAIKFLGCLKAVLDAGVKVTVVGSINDQVVPLYSAMFSGITHPGLIRAVYIDSAAFRTSDFLANLVVFSARLRNAGLRDHDLVYHLSEALAGALTGVGHSKIYEEPDVYTLAVRYQFEVTALTEAPTALDVKQPPSEPLAMSFNPRERRNPYLLTWAVRGLIEDPQVRELFANELTALREAFETWRPSTKPLREVKMKLEGIRMLPRAHKQREGKL